MLVVSGLFLHSFDFDFNNEIFICIQTIVTAHWSASSFLRTSLKSEDISSQSICSLNFPIEYNKYINI